MDRESSAGMGGRSRQPSGAGGAPFAGVSWYQAHSNSFPCCLTHKYIRFIDASGQEQASPVHGNAFFYLGKREERFREIFSAIGAVTRPF
jgi:hypothetical protein